MIANSVSIPEKWLPIHESFFFAIKTIVSRLPIGVFINCKIFFVLKLPKIDSKARNEEMSTHNAGIVRQQ